MDHSVAVRAEQGQLANLASLLATNVEWLDVVALDVALPALTVKLAEVELAYLAGQRSASRDDAVDLLPPQGGVSLAVGVPAEEVAPLYLAFTFVAGLGWESRRLSSSDQETDRLGQSVHHVTLSNKQVRDLAIQGVAVGIAPCVTRKMLSYVPGLLRDTVRVSELRQTLFHWVQRHLSQQLRKLDDALVRMIERTSIVLHDKITSENDLFKRPIQAPWASMRHEPMVRICGWQCCQTQRIAVEIPLSKPAEVTAAKTSAWSDRPEPARATCSSRSGPPDAGYRSLIYTAASSPASDAYIEGITQNWTPLAEAIHTEDSAEADRLAELSRWLDERGLSMTQLTWAGHDVPRLTLPARHFPLGDAPVKDRAEFPLRQVGSYLTPQHFVVQLWCPDQSTRREAAMQRALEYADATTRDTADMTRFLTQISSRLEVRPPLTVTDLRTYARRTGRGTARWSRASRSRSPRSRRSP